LKHICIFGTFITQVDSTFEFDSQVFNSGADSIGHGTRAPTFTNGWARGHRE